MFPDIEAGLRQLNECVKRIELLLMFRTLSDGKSSDGVSFRFDDRSEEDIRNEVSAFWGLDFNVRDALRYFDHQERARYLGRLREMERRLGALRVEEFK